MATTTNETLRKLLLSGRFDQVQPCYLFDSEKFTDNLARFYSSFNAYFGDKFIPSYSTKTNPDFAVLTTLAKSKDWMIEIVSDHERHLAAACGFRYDRVVYNGVVPDPLGKIAVATEGGIVNVESYTELVELAAYAQEWMRPIEVGLRVNIDIDPRRNWKSRFGIIPDSEMMEKCLKLQGPYLKIVGIHCHIHGCRSLEFWHIRAAKLGTLAKKLNLKYIDFGSNMFGYMDDRLAEQFNMENIPTPDDYARVIHFELSRIFTDGDMPTVIVEPGTPVVADTVSLLGRIEAISERGFDTIATASCSIYDCGFFHGSDKHPPVDIINAHPGKHYKDVEIFGYACTEDDTVCQSYTGELAEGDYILIRNVGAYGKSLSSDFIKQSPKMYDLALH